MSQKLGRDKNIKSIGALQGFYFEKGHNNGPFSANIRIEDRNSGEVEILNTNVTIAFDNMTQRINIMWEDAGYLRE